MDDTFAQARRIARGGRRGAVRSAEFLVYHRPVRLAVLILLTACGAGAGGPDADPGQPISRFEAVENPGNALSRFVSWRTSAPVPTRLEVDCGDYAPTITGEQPRTEHEVFLLGLYPGASCALRAVAGADGEATIQIDVGAVPAALPRPAVELTPGAGALQPGYTLVNLSNAALEHPLTVALFDLEGRYRWYHRMPVTEAGSDIAAPARFCGRSAPVATSSFRPARPSTGSTRPRSSRAERSCCSITDCKEYASTRARSRSPTTSRPAPPRWSGSTPPPPTCSRRSGATPTACRTATP